MKIQKLMSDRKFYKPILVTSDTLSPRYLACDMPGFMFSFGGIFYE